MMQITDGLKDKVWQQIEAGPGPGDPDRGRGGGVLESANHGRLDIACLLGDIRLCLGLGLLGKRRQ